MVWSGDNLAFWDKKKFFVSSEENPNCIITLRKTYLSFGVWFGWFLKLILSNAGVCCSHV